MVDMAEGIHCCIFEQSALRGHAGLYAARRARDDRRYLESKRSLVGEHPTATRRKSNWTALSLFTSSAWAYGTVPYRAQREASSHVNGLTLIDILVKQIQEIK